MCWSCEQTVNVILLSHVLSDLTEQSQLEQKRSWFMGHRLWFVLISLDLKTHM